jgi:hypothetical protein
MTTVTATTKVIPNNIVPAKHCSAAKNDLRCLDFICDPCAREYNRAVIDIMMVKVPAAKRQIRSNSLEIKSLYKAVEKTQEINPVGTKAPLIFGLFRANLNDEKIFLEYINLIFINA